MRGSPLRVSLVVRKDSTIKTVQDVKGKRVTGEYPANLAIWFYIFTGLASAGLTWDDVKVVPVPAVNEGVDAVVQGRADVSNHAIGAAKIKEADASGRRPFHFTGLFRSGRGACQKGGSRLLCHGP